MQNERSVKVVIIEKQEFYLHVMQSIFTYYVSVFVPYIGLVTDNQFISKLIVVHTTLTSS